MLYENTIPFYIRDFSIHRFGYERLGPGTIFHGYQDTNCYLFWKVVIFLLEQYLVF